MGVLFFHFLHILHFPFVFLEEYVFHSDTMSLDRLISKRRMLALGILSYDTPISMCESVDGGEGGARGEGVRKIIFKKKSKEKRKKD